jgi:tetratricopeptide (TPR) repeat protein
MAEPRALSWRLPLGLAAVTVTILAIGLVFQLRGGESRKTAAPQGIEATFVGSETCARCHQAEARLWQGSQHQLAMAHASDKSVLGDFSDSTIELRAAADLASDGARYAYVYGVALHSAGRQQDAIAYLKERQNAHPGDRDILMAIASFSREAGDLATALQYAERPYKIAPDDPTVARLLDELRRPSPPR